MSVIVLGVLFNKFRVFEHFINGLQHIHTLC